VVGVSALYPVLFRGFFHDGHAIDDAGQIVVHAFAPGDTNRRSALLTPTE